MKQLFTGPRTPAQTILLHSAESAGLSALLTIITASGQYIILHGLNWPGLWSVLSISFLAQMSMLYKSLSANPQTAQAIRDTLPELASALKDELMKLADQESQQAQIAGTPTRPDVPIVKGNTPGKLGA